MAVVAVAVRPVRHPQPGRRAERSDENHLSGPSFRFRVTNDNFHAFVDKLRQAGIEERDDHGEREGRRPEQLALIFESRAAFVCK